MAYLTTKMATADPSCVPPVGYIATFSEKGFKQRQVVITESYDDESVQWRVRKYLITDISSGKQWDSMGQHLITKKPFWQVVPVDAVMDDGTFIPVCGQDMEETVSETELLSFDEPMEEESLLLKPDPKILTESTGRFLNLSDADLDQMASNRVSKNTHFQTKWGMAVFRGKYMM